VSRASQSSDTSQSNGISQSSGILNGMRVIEGSAFVAAPLGGMTLAQLGADVIRFDPIRGGLDYDRWRAALPPPLTPALLRGAELNRSARRRAGQGEAFLERLAAEPPATARSPR